LTAESLGGLIRTLNQEAPQLSWSQAASDFMAAPVRSRPAAKLVQLTGDSSHSDAFGLMTRGRAVFEPKLLPSSAEEALSPHHLMPLPRGSLTTLTPLPVPVDTTLGPDKVLMQVRAVGLNFRDVLNVLGMYPGDPGPPGGDCAGILMSGHLYHEGQVIAGPGDAVFGLAGGSLGSHVIASSKTVVPMPPSITFEEASTMPTVFVTVDTALNRLAAAKTGQTVLMHAAAGGVGLAAMQIMRAVGAVPFVTAGNPTKRSLLRRLGASHAVSSRDTMFAEDFLSSAGRGADVVLNTLTSSGMVAATLSSMNYGGYFIEISKRDIWSTARMMQERPDVRYSLLAVDFMSADALHSALMRVSDGLAASKLQPLPTAAHDMRAVISAFRQMSQARHVGKIVVRPRPPLGQEACSGTILVTGGTGKYMLHCSSSRIENMHRTSDKCLVTKIRCTFPQSLRRFGRCFVAVAAATKGEASCSRR